MAPLAEKARWTALGLMRNTMQTCSSVGRHQRVKHRKVLDVFGEQAHAERKRRGGDGQVCRVDSAIARQPFSPQLSGTPCYPLIHRVPHEGPKERTSRALFLWSHSRKNL